MDGKILQIKLDVQKEWVDTWSKEDIKTHVIDIAKRIHQLIIENSSTDVIFLVSDGDVAKMHQSQWGGQESSSSMQIVPELKDRITAFSIQEWIDLKDKKSIEKIQALYQGAIQDPALLEDFNKLIKWIGERSFSEKHVTTGALKQFIDSFLKIDDPMKRNLLLKTLKDLSNYQWLACVSMIVDANVKSTWECRNGDLRGCANVLSWTSILEVKSDAAELFEDLSRRGIDFNMKEPERAGSTLLLAAISKGQDAIAQTILDHGDIEDRSVKEKAPLMLACKKGRITIVRRLLQVEGIDINHSGSNDFPLAEAIKGKHSAVVEALLLTGEIEDVNAGYRSYTLLTRACFDGSLEIVRLLLAQNGIDINKRDENENTPLGMAIDSGCLDVVKELLKDPRLQVNALCDEKSSPLTAAYMEEYLSIFEEILKHPDIDVISFLNVMAERSKPLDSAYLEKLKELHPEVIRSWFATHSEMQIAQFIHEKKDVEAAAELEKQLASNPSFAIGRLLKVGDPVITFFQNNPESLRSWAVGNKIFESLSLEEQRLLMFAIYPRFYTYMDGGGVLGPEGIKLIINYLRNKEEPSLPAEDCITVCPDRAVFAKALKLLAENPDVKDGDSHTFIVTKYSKNPHSVGGHVTPVYLKRVNNAWEMLITDSTTDYTNCTKEDSSCAPLVAVIEQVEKEMGELFNVRFMHVSTFWRQSDNENCYLITVRDAVYFHRHGDALLEKLSANAAKSQRKVHYFSDLPPQLMKVTQSIFDLNRYIDGKRYQGIKPEMMATKKRPEGKETLAENLARHTVKAPDGSDKLRNTLVSDRGLKYQKIVLNTLMQELYTS